jgi:ribosome-binding ATPase YchF (GTP1/OBG family)
VGISESAIDSALNLTGLKIKKINAWTEQDILFFTKMVREKSKPMVIAANKADISTAELNIQAISKNHTWVIPCTSEGESLLKKASKNGIVHYLPGDNSFEIRNTSNVTEKQSHVLGVVSKFIKKYGSTGIQQVINTICFEILEKIVVYPVENEIGLTDKKGNILPEAYLVDKGTTAKHLAAMVHKDLEKGFLFAIDVRTKKRVGADYHLKNNDVIKIVSALNRS